MKEVKDFRNEDQTNQNKWLETRSEIKAPTCERKRLVTYK